MDFTPPPPLFLDGILSERRGGGGLCRAACHTPFQDRWKEEEEVGGGRRGGGHGVDARCHHGRRSPEAHKLPAI